MAFALLAVAQPSSRFLFVFFFFCTLGLYCNLFTLYVGVDDPKPNWQPKLAQSLRADMGM